MSELIANYSFNIGVGLIFATASLNFYWRTKGLIFSSKEDGKRIYKKIVLHWGFFISYAIGVCLMSLDSIVNRFMG